MKRIIVLIALTFFVSACKKDRTIHFTGKVVNAVTGEGIEGVEMKLIENKGADPSDPFISNTNAVVTINSGIDGSFEINHTGWNRYGYYVLTNLDSENYYMIGWQNGGDEIKEVELEEIQDNLEIVPKGRYRYDIKNINCFDETDSLHLELVWLGCFEQYGVSGKINIGDYRWDYYVIRDGLRTDSSVFFTVYENDTTDIQIHY